MTKEFTPRKRAGRDKDLAARERAIRETRELPAVEQGALVLRSSRGHAWLEDANDPSGERHVHLPRWAQVVPGDLVAADPAGRIVGQVPRRSVLRRMAGIKGEQDLAANVDRVAIVVGPGLLLREGFLARALCACAADRIPALIVFQKVDLDTEHAMAARAGLYASLGFDVAGTSAKTGEGVSALKKTLAGSTTVLLGQSGVGKSTLVNTMYGLDLRTGEVDAWGRGRHTTTLARAIRTRDGILIDLPGVRELGLTELDAPVIETAFPDIAAAGRACRYPGCRHLDDEGCALDDAVERGAVDPARLEAWRHVISSWESGIEGGGRA